jgi:hypothetical protein
MQNNISTNYLTDHEAENPCLVFYELFDYASLPQLKEGLWLWLKLTVTGGYTKKEFQYNDRANILTLYEHLEKLLEASYLIYSDRKEELRRLHHQIIRDELREEND